jgi:hypothetical protein
MAIYYVDTVAGNNANSGTTFANAFKTITKGISVLNSGDALKIGAGIYKGEALVINKPNVVVEPYGNGVVTIDGEYKYPLGSLVREGIVLPDGTVTTGYTNAALLDINANGVTLRGINGRNSRGRGMRIYDCENILVEDCTMEGARNSALLIWFANDLIIRRSTFSYGCNYAPAWRTPQTALFPKGADFSRCNNGLIEDCELHHFYGGALGSTLSTNTIFRGCKIHDSWRTGINLTASTDVLVENCHVYQEDPLWVNRAFGGIIFLPENDAPGGTNVRCIFQNNLVVDYDGACNVGHETLVINDDCKMINNTFINRKSGEAVADLRKTHPTLTIENNIFYAGSGVTANITSEFINSDPTFTNNLWYGYTPDAGIQGPNYLNADPLFVNINGAASIRDNFKLLVGSPAIDSATNNAPLTDLTGASRSGVPDRGAFEYASGVTIPVDVPCDNSQNGEFIRTILNSTNDSAVLGGAWSNNTTLRVGDQSSTIFDDRFAVTFHNIPVNVDNIIESAIVTLTIRATTGVGGKVLIRGEKSLNPVHPSSIGDFDGRTKTTASVIWNVGTPTLDTQVTTPDLSAIIQEIIDQPGWVNGNRITLYFTDNQGAGYQGQAGTAFDSYDEGEIATGPKLEVEYSCFVSGGVCDGNILLNSDFSSGEDNWTATSDGVNEVSGGQFHISGTIATSPFNQLLQGGLNIVEGTAYTLSVLLRSVGAVGSIRAQLLQDNSPFANLGLNETFSVSTEQTVYTLNFVATADELDARLRFTFFTGDFYIDDVCLTSTGAAHITADFYALDPTVNEDEPLTFVNNSTSTNGITSYLWNFGDGRTSTDFEPIGISYPDAGEYMVTLTVNGPDGESSATTLVTINEVLPPEVTANNSIHIGKAYVTVLVVTT